MADAQDKGLVDQTRGILTWVTENCPDNFHANIGYATVRPPWPLCLLLPAWKDALSTIEPFSCLAWRSDAAAVAVR